MMDMMSDKSIRDELLKERLQNLPPATSKSTKGPTPEPEIELSNEDMIGGLVDTLTQASMIMDDILSSSETDEQILALFSEQKASVLAMLKTLKLLSEGRLDEVIPKEPSRSETELSPLEREGRAGMGYLV